MGTLCTTILYYDGRAELLGRRSERKLNGGRLLSRSDGKRSRTQVDNNNNIVAVSFQRCYQRFAQVPFGSIVYRPSARERERERGGKLIR